MHDSFQILLADPLIAVMWRARAHRDHVSL
jgi:hypothetical protein